VTILLTELAYEFFDVEFFTFARIEFAQTRHNFSAQPPKCIDPLEQLPTNLLLRRFREIRHL